MDRNELLWIAKPILFNTDMVRAILDGRKNVTRRVCKDGNEYAVPDMSFYDADKRTYAVHNYADKEHTDKLSIAEKSCPICPGDYLYVRETWQTVFETEYDDKAEEYCSNIRKFISNFDSIPKICVGLSTEYSCKSMTPRNKYYVYKASDISFANSEDGLLWRPSIHMPKEAARIFLRVTDVHLKRLKDLSVGDLKAEGIDCSGFLGEHPTLTAGNLFSKFEEIWNSTIHKKDLEKYGWAANPWVWVIQFERVEVDK